MPDWLIPVLFAPLVGSFLSVLVERLPAGEGVVLGRSRCPSCRHALGPRDLVPILSWLLLRGRCRFCQAAIGIRYPAVEVLAVLVAASAAALVSGWLLWASCLLGWTLLALALTDLRHFLLPDLLTLPLIPAGLAVATLIDPSNLPNHGIGAAAGYLVFALIRSLYARLRGREGLGLGDAKLLAAAGAWLSWPALPSVVLLAGLGALVATLARRAAGAEVAADERVPLGTWLCAAIWLVWLYGPLQLG